ncbi:MAG: flagellar basal body-associated FliL family protein [Methylococcales bacterium]|nr:flagellar basal body-associated FliL family protein [Methylococcales bacterium]
MAENEVEDSEEGEEKKSSKKIIIIGLVVLLLAGAGGGYYFFMGNPEESEGDQTEEIIDEEEEVEDGVDEEIYYDMQQPLVVNFPKGSGANLIQVSISLLVKGEETVEALKKHEPMIRNNLLMAISAKGAKNLKTVEGKEALRDEMLKEVSHVMEKMTKTNKVMNVFFTTFVMQ